MILIIYRSGCVWHGCPTCFPNDRQKTKHPRTKQSLEELYTLTLKKESCLRKKGYNYVCIWEHEFCLQKQTDVPMQNYLKNIDIQERLQPRDAFFGGRTNATRLHYEVAEGEKIQYVDFTR